MDNYIFDPGIEMKAFFGDSSSIASFVVVNFYARKHKEPSQNKQEVLYSKLCIASKNLLCKYFVYLKSIIKYH